MEEADKKGQVKTRTDKNGKPYTDEFEAPAVACLADGISAKMCREQMIRNGNFLNAGDEFVVPEIDWFERLRERIGGPSLRRERRGRGGRRGDSAPRRAVVGATDTAEVRVLIAVIAEQRLMEHMGGGDVPRTTRRAPERKRRASGGSMSTGTGTGRLLNMREG